MYHKKIFNKNVLQWFASIAIIVVLIFQCYSLISQYDYLSKSLARSYEEAFVSAVDRYRTFQFDKLRESQGVSLRYNFKDRMVTAADTLTSTSDHDLEVTTEVGENNLSTDQILYKINSYVIASASFDIRELDSIMLVVLEKKDILCNYDLIVYSTKENQILNRTENKVYPQSLSVFQTQKRELDSIRDVQMYYENPASIILQKMLVYLIFSAIVLIVVILAIYYQWKIIKKQKKIERVRQDFVDSMTHELRHPLQGALAVAELMENPSFVHHEERRITAVSRIKNNLHNIDQLLESIVIRSYSEELWFEPQLEEGNLRDIINEIIASFVLNNIKRADFVANFDDSLTPFKFDLIHLTNAIKNLVDNSLKYSNDEVKIEVSVYIKGDLLEIIVSDNGFGIRDKDLNKIFNKFYKIDHFRRNYGLGLGLSYVEWVCKMHKGTISVQSKYNKGSRFTILIPFINE